jgi:hypothetical protein
MLLQERPVDQLDMDAAVCTSSMELAVSMSLRASRVPTSFR